jgi:NADPH:quinone reductase-like Zn-dependent oxidoreductase
MKAWIYRRYGGPEVLEWAEVDTPVPGAGEIRIRVVAAALNPLDWKLIDGQFKFMTLGRLPRGVGFDVAGEVDAVGPGVSRFRAGDAVVAAVHPMGSRQGTVAELVCTKVAHSAAKPAALDWNEAAAIPGSGMTALQTFRQARIRPGGRALIVGAAGGVGSFAVGLAKAGGMHVTAVASASAQALLATLPADRRIDYSATDWRRLGERFDFVFDCSGTSRYADVAPLLADDGVYAHVLPGAAIYIRAWWLGATSKRRIVPVMERVDGKDIAELVALAAEGKLRIPVTRVSGPEQLPALLAEMRQGHGRGKVVVRIRE